MLPESFAIVGAVIGSLGGLWYLREAVGGNDQSNRVTVYIFVMNSTFAVLAFRRRKARSSLDPIND